MGPARGARRRGGFTIVEVMVAMAILLIGMTSILGLLSFGAALSRTAALRNAGAAAAEAVVADLEESLFPLEVDPATGRRTVGEPADVVDRPVPGHDGIFYSARARPEAEDPPPGGARAWRVDVEIRWMTGGHRRTKTFTTLLLGEVPFGERLRRELVEGELAPAAPPGTPTSQP